jgi:hypothetical protein
MLLTRRQLRNCSVKPCLGSLPETSTIVSTHSDHVYVLTPHLVDAHGAMVTQQCASAHASNLVRFLRTAAIRACARNRDLQHNNYAP